MRFIFVCVSLILVYRGVAQDFVFPKEEVASHLSGNNPVITERIPVYIPMRCAENMLLYPGAGDKSTWMCDCKPGFLYFPLNNTCHEAYRQGPCPTGSYVHIPINDAVPRCTENPCVMDGFVPYNGYCHELGTTGGPCDRDILGVNLTTFEIQCILSNPLPPRPTSIPHAPTAGCPTGSRRLPSGRCGILN